MSNPASKLTAAGKAFSSLCRRWVHPSVTDEAEVALRTRINALMLATPPVALSNLVLNLPSGFSVSTAVPAMALGVALPIISLAALAIMPSRPARNAVTSLSGPVALLSITGGFAAVVPAAWLVTGIAAAQAARWRDVRKPWLASAALAALTGTALSWMAAPAAMSMLALAPLAAAAIAGMWLNQISGRAASGEQAPVADAGIAHLGALLPNKADALISFSRNGAVLGIAAPGEQFGLDDKSGAPNFVERVHLADRLAFLRFLDGLSQGESGQFALRYNRCGDGKTWSDVRLTALRRGDAIWAMLTGEKPVAAVAANVIADHTLAAIAHELKTPLNVLIGFSDMLRQEFSGPLSTDRQREHAELIHLSGSQLLETLNALLDWSKAENGKFTPLAAPFSPSDVAANAIAMAAPAARRKQIGLDFQPLCAFDEFRGDERIVRQILTNLLSNAVKFTPDGGMIRLIVDIEDNGLRIVVEDSGVGMTAEQLSALGTPFFQAGHPGQAGAGGNGLGVALIKQMATAHGGAVEYVSTPGQGTKATIVLGQMAEIKSLPQAPAGANVDESTRIIRIFKERSHGTHRKTA